MIPFPFDVGIVSNDLTDEENQIVSSLMFRLSQDYPYLESFESYYDGTQPMRNLGIAVPHRLSSLHTASGWPRIAVDALEEKLDVEGFRFPNSTDADSDLWDIWTANRMDQESQLAHLDALVFGRSFVTVGTNDDGSPKIAVESPMNMAAELDIRTQRVQYAIQAFSYDGEDAAALYLPDQTVYMVRDRGVGSWKVYNRDAHNLGFAPVALLTNRSRAHDRYGRSEITPEIQSITDAACRTLLGMEIAREFFAAPQRYVLGASEDAFVNPDGTPTDAWETYIGRWVAFERDSEGEVPAVGSFPAADPTPFISILQQLARSISGLTGLPPHLLGFAADNPASAEAIRSSEARLDKRALRKQRAFEGTWRTVMQMALSMSGSPSEGDVEKLDVLWREPATPTPAATTSAILQQVQMGYLPAASDVTGEKLGYSAVERARIEDDRKREQGSQALQAITARLGAMNGSAGSAANSAEGGATAGPQSAAENTQSAKRSG